MKDTFPRMKKMKKEIPELSLIVVREKVEMLVRNVGGRMREMRG
jgi:hypothetical protein